jgi:hypothetical protein
MKNIGGILAFFGAGSFVLNMMGREFALTMWIDTWGPTTGTAIRIGLIVVGAALWFVGMKQEAAAADSGPAAPAE